MELSRIKCVEIVKSDIIIPCQYKYPFQVSLSVAHTDRDYHFILYFNKILPHSAVVNEPNTGWITTKEEKADKGLKWTGESETECYYKIHKLLHSLVLNWKASLDLLILSHV